MGFEEKALAGVLSRRAWVMITSLRLLLPAKARSPREVTEAGMLTAVRLLPLNAPAPIDVTEGEMVSDVSFLFW